MKSFVLVAAFAFVGTAALAADETTINVKEMNVNTAPKEESIVEPGAVEVSAESDAAPASEEKAK